MRIYIIYLVNKLSIYLLFWVSHDFYWGFNLGYLCSWLIFFRNFVNSFSSEINASSFLFTWKEIRKNSFKMNSNYVCMSCRSYGYFENSRLFLSLLFDKNFVNSRIIFKVLSLMYFSHSSWRHFKIPWYK